MFPIEFLILGLIGVGLVLVVELAILIVLAWRIDDRALRLLDNTKNPPTNPAG